MSGFTSKESLGTFLELFLHGRMQQYNLNGKFVRDQNAFETLSKCFRNTFEMLF
jgi:hypothetical protein